MSTTTCLKAGIASYTNAFLPGMDDDSDTWKIGDL